MAGTKISCSGLQSLSGLFLFASTARLHSQLAALIKAALGRYNCSIPACQRMKRHSFGHKARLTFLSVLMLIALGAPTRAELTDVERDLIKKFEMESGQRFSDFFSRISHQMEFCIGSAGVCYRKLNKRTTDYDFIINGQSNFPNSERKRNTWNTLIQTMEDVTEITELKPNFGQFSQTSAFILLIFVDRHAFETAPKDYLRTQITVPQFGDVEYRERSFRWFLDSDLPCMGITGDFDQGEVADAHLWIKNDLSEVQTRKCVAEEIFNSFGLDEGADVPSIFDWPLSDFKERKGLSTFHLLLLKLFYRPEFEPGQSIGETKAEIERLLRQD